MKLCLCVCVFSIYQPITEFLFLLGRFIKGLPVNNAALSEELKRAIGLVPMPKGISYVISTKVHKNTDIKDDIALFFSF